MELREALSKAKQILDEERVSPTVSYDCDPQGDKGAAPVILSILVATNLQAARSKRPREINENPTWYRFKSTNYNLLCALMSHVCDNDRKAFVSSVAPRIVSTPGCVR